MKKILVTIVIVLVLGGFLIFQKLQSPSMIASTPSELPTNNNTPVASTTPPSNYKDGSYTGKIGSASQYGDVQVKVTIVNGKITDIEYLKFPDGPGHTSEVTAIAKPALKKEAITAQSANIDNITGATQDVEGFQQSLQSALDQAVS